MTDQPTGMQLVMLADEHIDRTLDRIDRGAAPVFQAQFEMGRTVVTVSSGAIVFTVTLTQYLAAQGQRAHWSILLGVSWLLFIGAIILGVLRQAWAGEAQILRAAFEPKRAEIRRALHNLVPGPEFAAQFDAIVTEPLFAAQAVAVKAARTHDHLTKWMLLAFVGGFVALLVFAGSNLRL